MPLSLRARAASSTSRRCISIPYTALLIASSLAACDKTTPTESRPAVGIEPSASNRLPPPADADSLRAQAATRGIVALTRPARVRESLVKLGQALAFDPILSGNRNIACATCHLPAFATGDARNLSIGEGGAGFGPDRRLEHGLVIARNAPPLFNLAAMTSLFWDGRVSRDAAGVFHTPANAQLTPEMTRVFEFGAASAVGLFPVTTRPEMRGFVNDASSATPADGNELAPFDDADFTGIWTALMARLGAIPEYRRMFEAAYPGTPFESMTFAHASNAMAGFFVQRLSFDNSPWDRFLAGDDAALTPEQFRGARTFVNSNAKCAACHNGPAFSDQKFRNVALAQFGPGKGNGPSGRDDFGRINISGIATEKYAFRTTPLRNVELSAPYGHAGQFAELRDFVDHYSESDVKLANYDVRQIDPSLRSTLLSNTTDILATRSGALAGLVLTQQQIDDLTAYLRALTDPAARHLDGLTPVHVPSGFPVGGEKSPRE
jgi:cytochrome c peroxidase